MKESGDRTIKLKQIDILNFEKELPAIDSLKIVPPQTIVPYSYRSFDRQYLLADNRLISRPRPQLWYTHSEKQMYLTGLFSIPLDNGPALIACSEIPDLDCFRGSYGAKAVIPLYLNNSGTQSNTTAGLLDLLGDCTAEDLAGYVYCVLAQPEYTLRFADELVNREVRVPITKNKKLFIEASEFGKQLIWTHTYGERLYNSKDRPKGKIQKGKAKCVKGVPEGESEYPNEYQL